VTPDDQSLIDACLAGQTEAFGELVERYQDRVLHALTRMLGSYEDARDVAQDAFVQAFRKLDTFRGESAFYSWLFRIAANKAISHMRKRKHRAASSLEAQDGFQPADPREDSSPTAELQRAERRQLVRRALDELHEDYRIVLVLKELEGLPYVEIAELIDCPIGTVRSRLHRARLELRRVLERRVEDV